MNDPVTRAVAYLSRVVEPPCPQLSALTARVGPVDAAAMVKRRTVDQWRQRATDFPAPRWTVGGRPAWNWDEVEVWAKRTGRKP